MYCVHRPDRLCYFPGNLVRRAGTEAKAGDMAERAVEFIEQCSCKGLGLGPEEGRNEVVKRALSALAYKRDVYAPWHDGIDSNLTAS